MIKLACCDDNALELEILRDLLKDYAREKKTELSVSCFASADALLRDTVLHRGRDLFILDMVMPGMNGAELAAELQKRGEKGTVIFLTASGDYLHEAFDVHAFQYLMKPPVRERLFRTLDEAISRITEKRPAGFTVRTRDGERRLLPEEILYAAREDHSLLYALSGGETLESVTLRTSVREAAAPLLADRRFVLAGASLILNLEQVEVLEKGYVQLKDGTELFPPERSYTELKKAWKSL